MSVSIIVNPFNTFAQIVANRVEFHIDIVIKKLTPFAIIASWALPGTKYLQVEQHTIRTNWTLL